MAEKMNATFLTAAIHTTGGMGEDFIQLLDELSGSFCSVPSGWEAAELVAGVRAAVAIGLQKGNARIMADNRVAVTKAAFSEEHRTWQPAPPQGKRPTRTAKRN